MTFWDFLRESRRSRGAIEGVWGLELLKRVGVRGPAGRPPCRTCGTDGCAKVACFREILTAEEGLAFKQRLAHHAAAAARDAATQRNGHGPA